jgi:transcriptional regulator with XRE-family HTH domain
MTGREQLAAWLKASPERKQAHLARDLGLSAASVSAWLSGHARPNTHYRVALERATGIPADDWMTEAERTIAFGEDEPGPTTKPSGEAA